MRKIYCALICVLLLASCSVENDDHVALPDARGILAFDDPGDGSDVGGTTNGGVVSIESDIQISVQEVVTRACSGRTPGPVLTEKRILPSSNSTCDPLSLMTPNFGYMMWNAWDVTPGTTAYFVDYYGIADPNAVFVQDFFAGHFQGLRNEGPPPPIAPGMTRQWVDDDFYSIFYEEVPDSNGDFPNLGDSQGINISTANLEFLRDELVCEILDTYFNDYFPFTAPDGYGYLIGNVDVSIVDPLCGDSRGLYITVNIGHYIYIAPDLPIIND